MRRFIGFHSRQLLAGRTQGIGRVDPRARECTEMNPIPLNSTNFKPDSTPVALAVDAARQVLLVGDVNNSDPEFTPAGQMPVGLAGFARVELSQFRLERYDAHSHWGLNE